MTLREALVEWLNQDRPEPDDSDTEKVEQGYSSALVEIRGLLQHPDFDVTKWVLIDWTAQNIVLTSPGWVLQIDDQTEWRSTFPVLTRTQRAAWVARLRVLVDMLEELEVPHA